MFSKKLVAFSLWIDHTRWARNTWAMAAIFVLTMAVIADMVRMNTCDWLCRTDFRFLNCRAHSIEQPQPLTCLTVCSQRGPLVDCLKTPSGSLVTFPLGDPVMHMLLPSGSVRNKGH